MDIKGSFTVQQNRFWRSNAQYEVLFTNDRLLFIKTGGQALIPLIIFVVLSVGLAGIGGRFYGILGYLGGAIIGGVIGSYVFLFAVKKNKIKADNRLNSLKAKSSEEIIQTDKNNFEIRYGEITDIKVDDSMFGLYGIRQGVLVIQGAKKLRFDITMGKQNAQDIKRLVASIPH
jgi:hypothetical protein